MSIIHAMKSQSIPNNLFIFSETETNVKKSIEIKPKAKGEFKFIYIFGAYINLFIFCSSFNVIHTKKNCYILSTT